MLKRAAGMLFPAVFAVYLPTERDTFRGPWGEEHAPDARATTYRFVRNKRHGVNPGLTVSDPQGREWNVKQAPQPALKGAEGTTEVGLSRVLSAIGDHQPAESFVNS